MEHRFWYQTPCGWLMAEGEQDVVARVSFCGENEVPPEGWEEAALPPVFEELNAWLDGYFCRKPQHTCPPLRPDGSAFQKEVWSILCNIPYGETMSYGEVAKKLQAQTGRKTSARAVGGAIGRNPIGILIPCHRVIGADGSLTGFAGGLAWKRYLLDLEGINYKQ